MKNIKKSKKKIKTKPKEKEKIVISTFSKIILENFKGYSKLTNIDLCSGVNLIYGKNSAGKSSIIQSLRFIRQNLLLLNASVPFIPISPVNMNLAGKIQFPEGIEGMIFAKDKKRELKLGVEIQSVSQNNQKINKRLLAHS
jgi:AAA15 family ATPase/GTPase